jgi:hypothetical protein
MATAPRPQRNRLTIQEFEPRLGSPTEIEQWGGGSCFVCIE